MNGWCLNTGLRGPQLYGRRTLYLERRLPPEMEPGCDGVGTLLWERFDRWEVGGTGIRHPASLSAVDTPVGTVGPRNLSDDISPVREGSPVRFGQRRWSLSQSRARASRATSGLLSTRLPPPLPSLTCAGNSPLSKTWLNRLLDNLSLGATRLPQHQESSSVLGRMCQQERKVPVS